MGALGYSHTLGRAHENPSLSFLDFLSGIRTLKHTVKNIQIGDNPVLVFFKLKDRIDK